MPGSLRLVDLVQERIDAFLDERAADLDAVADDLADHIAVARDLLAGGKRFRALFCYWGWQAVAALPAETDDVVEPLGAEQVAPVATVAAALELFHAAALVHDDIMDASDLRRGRPSVHRRFEALHRERGMLGDAGRFGTSSALLLGDLLLGWSDELLDVGTAGDPVVARAVRTEFVRMRTEVTAGQYLDVLEEGSWRSHSDTEQLRRAHRVILYKSAKYSVEAPLAIGAALAGGDADQLDALRRFGVPLGIAFQLRDDLLGVFGDPEVTGKPAGDDLREGKRTVLIALARQLLPPSAVRLLDELLGDPDLEADQITMLQSALTESGAVHQVERMIERNVGDAIAALGAARLTGSAKSELTKLADAVTRRNA